MEFPQKTDAAISLWVCIKKKKKTLIQKNTRFLMFIIFIIDEI